MRTPRVIPAKGGIHSAVTNRNAQWIPAFAGMTKGEAVALSVYDTRFLDQPKPAKPSAISDVGCALRAPLVIPAKAGIHSAATNSNAKWIPAFAGMTNRELSPIAARTNSIALI